MKILVAYEGKLKGHGLDLVAAQQLRALSDAGIETLLVARGQLSLPKLRCFPMRWSAAKLLSWAPKEIYYAAQQRAISRRAAGLLGSHRPTAILAWQRSALAAFRSARELRISTVLSSASAFAFKKNLSDNPPWPRIGNAYLKEEYELSDLILAPSTKAAEAYSEAGLRNVVSIERGFDPELFHPPATSPPGFRVLFCGRICARKGVDQLLAGWTAAKLSGAELWFAGSVDGEMQPVVEQYRNDPSIKWLGFRSDISEIMRQCHVHALLSSVESMGKSLIEAAASGLVNLTTINVGFPVEDGVTGLLVDRDNPASIAAALQRLQANPELRRTLGENARAIVLRDYSWQKFRERFIDAITPILDRSQS